MKRLLTVSFFTALLTLVRMACNFVIAKVVAIYTGPSGLAALGQVQNMVSTLNGLATAPAGNGVVRYTAEFREQGFSACAPWWRASLQWLVGIILIVIPLSFFLSETLSSWLFGHTQYAWLIILASCALPFSAINTLIASIINGQQLYRRYVVVGMVSALVATAVMISLIVQANLNGALISAAITSGISGIVMLMSSFRQPWFKFKYWWGKTEAKQRRDIGSYVLMAMTSTLTVPVALVVIRNIIITQVGWEQAGYWEAVRKISDVYLSVITLSLSTYFLPRLASSKGFDAIKHEINQTAKVIMPLVIILAASIYVLRDIVITLLFTEDFRPARDLFAIQLSGDVVRIFSYLYAYPMIARGATSWYMGTEVMFSLSYAVGSYFLVSQYGIKGAPIAYMLSYSLSLIFMRLNLKKFSV